HPYPSTSARRYIFCGTFCLPEGILPVRKRVALCCPDFPLSCQGRTAIEPVCFVAKVRNPMQIPIKEILVFLVKPDTSTYPVHILVIVYPYHFPPAQTREVGDNLRIFCSFRPDSQKTNLAFNQFTSCVLDTRVISR